MAGGSGWLGNGCGFGFRFWARARTQSAAELPSREAKRRPAAVRIRKTAGRSDIRAACDRAAARQGAAVAGKVSAARSVEAERPARTTQVSQATEEPRA